MPHASDTRKRGSQGALNKIASALAVAGVVTAAGCAVSQAEVAARPLGHGEARRYAAGADQAERAATAALTRLALEFRDRRVVGDTVVLLARKEMGNNPGGAWVRVVIVPVRDSTEIRVHSQRGDPSDTSARGNWRPMVFREVERDLAPPDARRAGAMAR